MERKSAEGPIAALPRGRPSRFHFEWATEVDDAELRELLRLTPMGGDVRLTLRREPSFFRAAAVEGSDYRVLSARDTHSGRIVAMGSVSIRLRYVEGRPEPVGYLSMLRVLPEFRRGTLLARGYRALRELLDRHSPARLYVTTIAEGNRQALAALTRRRARLPDYRPVGTYHSMVLPVGRLRRSDLAAGLQVRPLQADEIPAMVDFLHQVGRSRPFFPCYTAGDFVRPPKMQRPTATDQRDRVTFLNLPVESIWTAWQGTTLIGTLGLWDQLPFRQTVVEGYAPWLAWLRPGYNTWARLRRRPRFPSPRRPFRCLTAALPLVRGGNVSVFQALLSAAVSQSQAAGHDSLLIGMSALDPLFAAVHRQSVFQYVTNLYTVDWGDGSDQVRSPVERDFYLELGCL